MLLHSPPTPSHLGVDVTGSVLAARGAQRRNKQAGAAAGTGTRAVEGKGLGWGKPEPRWAGAVYFGGEVGRGS